MINVPLICHSHVVFFPTLTCFLSYHPKKASPLTLKKPCKYINLLHTYTNTQIIYMSTFTDYYLLRNQGRPTNWCLAVKLVTPSKVISALLHYERWFSAAVCLLQCYLWQSYIRANISVEFLSVLYTIVCFSLLHIMTFILLSTIQHCLFCLTIS